MTISNTSDGRITHVRDELYPILATTYAIAIKTQSCHWNVEGREFYSLHKLFEAQYNEMLSAVDEIAELIRIGGEKVSASFDEFSSASHISAANASHSASEMLKDLIKSHEELCKLITKTKPKNAVIAAFLDDRIAAHEKMIWFLRSSL